MVRLGVVGRAGNGQLSTHLLMLLCALLVSTSFSVGELIADDLDPAVITLVRFTVAALVLLPVIAVKHGLRVSLAGLCRYGMISGCLVAFFWCMFFALRFTTALNTSVLFTTVPAISAVYSLIVVRERFDKQIGVALLVGLIGALWVIFRGNLEVVFGLTWNKGDLIFLIGCFAMGFYTPLIKLLYRGEPMEVMTFWVLVTGCLWLIPLGGPPLLEINLDEVAGYVWWWISYLALFTTVATFYLTQYATPVIGPTRTMAYSYLYPGFVLIIDLALGRDFPGIAVVPGLLCIFGAMLLLQRPARFK